ncbi:MAG TPA: S8 family serine peptidase [Pyrinomonadaceae bacterium]|jgi:subtilisin family serine protease
MRPTFKRSFISLGLIFSLSITLLVAGRSPLVGQASAQLVQTKQKVSDDLREKLKSSSGERVNVVIQAKGDWTSTLDSALSSNGGSVRRSFQNFNARAVSLPAGAVDAMANRSDVKYVSLDRSVKLLGHLSLTTGADAARIMGGSKYDGTGIGIVVMDSGMYTNHASFNGRVVYSQDFTGEGRTDDPYGHGTHVASIAAGNGAIASGAYLGIAPGAKIINLRVLDSQGRGTVSSLMSGLDWIMTNRSNATYNIKVVNLSLGTSAVDSYRDDPLCQSVRRLVDAGIVVVAAAGNEGKDGAGNKLYGQIHSPGNDPSVITVGASNTFGTDYRSDDIITTYSSRGPTRSASTDLLGNKTYDNLIKPDLVAPGNKIIDAQSPSNSLVVSNPSLDANVSDSDKREQMYLSGTSMATPIVSGAAALLLQANPNLTPNLVKAILMYTAQPLAGYNNFEQGAGQVNLEGAMRLARQVRTDLSPAPALGAPLLCSGCTTPTPETTIAGHYFKWGGGIILDNTFATGSNLVTQYQKIYDLGVLLSDATQVSTTLGGSGVLFVDGTLLTDGVVLSDNILTSNGITISEGSNFVSVSSLVGSGALLSDGVLFADGGKLLGDGVLFSDGALLSDVANQANNALIYGDPTASVVPVRDPMPAAPTTLTAKAASTTQINLTWVDKSNNEEGFSIERCTGATCTNFVEVAQRGAGVTSFQNTGLVRATTYRFRVRAFHSGGSSGYTSIVNASTSK